MGTRIQELKWLAKQHEPVWGGHLARGEPISDSTMQAWVADGIIEAVKRPRIGYVLTEKGRKLIAGACPTCGRTRVEGARE